MTEKPILFNGEMVRAVLDGTKTQTRRVMRMQPEWIDSKYTGGHWYYTTPTNTGSGPFDPKEWVKYAAGMGPHCGCPYGAPGDRLWVRECHAISEDGCDCGNGLEDSWIDAVHYKADGRSIGVDSSDRSNIRLMIGESEDTTTDYEAKHLSWRPSIHMFRWASRINLEVVAVRVERVQDISEEDAIAEGVRLTVIKGRRNYYDPQEPGVEPSTLFAYLWDKINGKPRKDGTDISWKANPWVWVVEFKRLV